MTDGVGLPACPASLTRLAGRGGGKPFGCREAAGAAFGLAADAAARDGVILRGAWALSGRGRAGA